jgi:methyltransferase (TIGR00027 family)
MTTPSQQATFQQTWTRSGLAAGTAYQTARARAADAALEPERRLLGDDYARLFVSEPPPPSTPAEAIGRLRALDGAHGGFLAEILLRQRYFENLLSRVAPYRALQVVLLGAGYDSTALRHPDLPGVRFFEVDHPATQRSKLAALTEAGVGTPNVTYVAVDFEEGHPLDQELAKAGLDWSVQTIVGWLGVSFFLRPESFRRTLREVARGCAPGGLLVFDYLDQAVVDGTTPYAGARAMAEIVRERGEPYINGLTPATAAAAAEDAGFRVVENVRVRDLVRRFGGADPYCSDDDFMGVITAERLP